MTTKNTRPFYSTIILKYITAYLHFRIYIKFQNELLTAGVSRTYLRWGAEKQRQIRPQNTAPNLALFFHLAHFLYLLTIPTPSITLHLYLWRAFDSFFQAFFF